MHSQLFRFRVLVRGDMASILALSAVRSVGACHPASTVVVVDANDSPSLSPSELSQCHARCDVVHVRPDDDAIASEVGRGTRSHMYYWRHSPQVLSALPPFEGFDIHLDSDVLLTRPLHLGAWVRPLETGRILAPVDEAIKQFFQAVERWSIGGRAAPASLIGVVVQGGFIASNPNDDGDLYKHFWEEATEHANAGHVSQLPWDDMFVLSTLLGPGGALWSRWLPLGLDVDYITSSDDSHGVLAAIAHFGGRRAQSALAGQSRRLLRQHDSSTPWGSVTLHGARDRVMRGPWTAALGRPSEVPGPFCLTWRVPNSTRSYVVAVRGRATADPSVFCVFDGDLGTAIAVPGRLELDAPAECETMSLICLSRDSVEVLVESHD